MKPGIASLLVIVFLMLAAGCTQTVQSPAAVAVTPATPAPETPLAIKNYVDNAALFALQQGKPAALAAFNNRTGPFVTGDVYVYALDYSGRALALPFQPEEVGTDFLNRTDGEGKPFTAVEIQLVKNGGGYLLYRYPHPGNSSADRLKISYVRPVDETYWIGAGIYTSEERLVDPVLRQFVDEAKTYAMTNGRMKSAAAFNDPNGSFIRNDLYIFAYDYNGTVLAWPYRHDQVGQNRRDVTDPVGAYHIRSMIDAARNGSGMVDYYSVNPRTNRTDLKISYIADVDGTWFIGAGRYVEPGLVIMSA